MTSAGSAYLCLCVLLATLALSGYGASARAFTGPCHPGTPTAGEDLQIAIFPKFTRGHFCGHSPTINVSFAGARPDPARAFTQFYQHEFQKRFIGGKPCGRLHTN